MQWCCSTLPAVGTVPRLFYAPVDALGTVRSVMAFVLPTGAVGASTLHGSRVATPAVCANASIAMRAGGDATTRRAVLAGALAAAGLAILPGAAQAKGGDGAKQSFFGAGAISNPFTYNEKSVGPVVYKVRWCGAARQGPCVDWAGVPACFC